LSHAGGPGARTRDFHPSISRSPPNRGFRMHERELNIHSTPDARAWLLILARYREPSGARSVLELAITAVPLVILWILMWAQRRRARTTSARSCSAARRFFLKVIL
jgi:hypothetical protein